MEESVLQERRMCRELLAWMQKMCPDEEAYNKVRKEHEDGEIQRRRVASGTFGNEE